jgi:hypothetical protein
MTSTQTYMVFKIVCAVAMIGWAVGYGYANHEANQCTQAFTELAESNKARSKNLLARIDKVRAREESLQTRSNDLIKKFDTPDGSENK